MYKQSFRVQSDLIQSDLMIFFQFLSRVSPPYCRNKMRFTLCDSSGKSDFKFGLYYVAPIVHLEDNLNDEFAIKKIAILGELDKWAHFSPNRVKQERIEIST